MGLVRQKIQFQSQGVSLSGLLESPQRSARAYALFAHCFSCSKDIAAAARISRQLVDLGFAVLRFDFTGLGHSEGEFENTNFSSNVDDLIAAATFLRDEYAAPQLLVGHSLGGRAVLSAASRIAEVRAVATIGAPADAHHVSKQFAVKIDEIKENGVAEVELAGRPFTIKKQFLDDICESNQDIEHLRKPILVMHSPIDATVSIEQAELIYRRAKHPKSFVTLDNANHLLTDKADAAYAAQVIASWSARYIELEGDQREFPAAKKGEVLVHEENHRFTRQLVSDHHQWLADEPPGIGDNRGPDPYEHLLAALGACTSMTLRMYANRKKIPLDDVVVNLRHSREHGEDCQHCDEQSKKVDLLHREVTLKGNLSAEQRQRLMEIADRCPVHQTLENKIVIKTNLV